MNRNPFVLVVATVCFYVTTTHITHENMRQVLEMRSMVYMCACVYCRSHSNRQNNHTNNQFHSYEFQMVKENQQFYVQCSHTSSLCFNSNLYYTVLSTRLQFNTCALYVCCHSIVADTKNDSMNMNMCFLFKLIRLNVVVLKPLTFDDRFRKDL